MESDQQSTLYSQTGTTVLYARSGKFSNLLFKAINQDDIRPGRNYFSVLPQRPRICISVTSRESSPWGSKALCLPVHCTLTHPSQCNFKILLDPLGVKTLGASEYTRAPTLAPIHDGCRCLDPRRCFAPDLQVSSRVEHTRDACSNVK